MMLDVGPTTSPVQLDFIKIFYEYAYLSGRSTAGSRLSQDEARRLRTLGSLLEHPVKDRAAHRRVHRRRPAGIPVLLKPGGSVVFRGTVLNLSGGGMLVASPAELELGGYLKATVGRPGEVEYIFTCQVVRRDAAGWGLRFCGIPLEIRYGNYRKTAERAVG